MDRPMWSRAVYPIAVVMAAAAVLVAGQPAVSAVSGPPVANDYNGDGHADMVATEPSRTVGGVGQAGVVHVIYGSPTGLATAGSQLLAQGHDGVPGTPEDLARFGYDLISGNFNGDGYADIAVSAPNSSSSVITVLYGSAQGIQGAGGRAFSQAEISTVPCCHNLGVALAAGDFNHDGRDDLAYGQTKAPLGGGVGVLYGSASGLDTAGKQFFTQGSPDVPGVGESTDRFGAALAAGDFDGDGDSDLAISAPLEDVGDIRDAGSVTILPGSPSGLTGVGGAVFTEATAGVPGTAEEIDRFGYYSVAAGDINGDGKHDLVVGTSFEHVGTVFAGGAITVLYGSASGVTATGSQNFTQASSGIPSTAELEDNFGQAVAVGDFDGDSYADVAVGSPGEDLTGGADAGSVTVIPGTAAGLTSAGATVWSQSSSGVVDSAEAHDYCGWGLLAIRIRDAARSDLVFACQGEGTAGFEANGAIVMLPGSPGGLTGNDSQLISADLLTGGSGGSYHRFGFEIG